MPSYLTEMAKGSGAITQMEQDITARQTAELQRQYIPEALANDMQQKIQATQLQQANIQKLQATIGNEAEAGKAIQAATQENPGKPQSEIFKAAVSKLASSGVKDPTVLMSVAKMAESMAVQETKAADLKQNTETKQREHRLALSRGTDYSSPVAVDMMLRNAEANEGLKPEESQQVRDMIKRLGPKQAKEWIENSLKTQAQKDREIKLIEEARKDREAEADRKAAAQDRKEERTSRAALARDKLADKIKEKEDKITGVEKDRSRITSRLDRDVKDAHKEAIKDWYKLTPDQQEIRSNTYDQEIEAANRAARSEWEDKDHEGPAPTRERLDRPSPKPTSISTPEKPVDKATGKGLQGRIEALGGSYEPEKYTYRIDGEKIFRKPK